MHFVSYSWKDKFKFDERYATVYFGRDRETPVVLEELRQMQS